MLTPDLTTIRAQLSLSGLVNVAALTDPMLTQKFNAAYAQAQRELRVFFEPTEIIPDDAPQAEIDALELANTPYHEESAYNYDSGFWYAERLGFMPTRQKPIIKMHSMIFAFPSANQTIFTVPIEWIRMDKKYGHIKIVPTTLGFAVPLPVYLMQIMGMGSGLPFMLRLRYQAGLKDIATNYPDIIELLNRMTMLSVLKGAFLPTSGSLSVDGISRSQGISIAAWQSSIDELMDNLRDSIHGVRMVVV